MKKIHIAATAPTLIPGSVNRNGQILVGPTGVKSTTMPGQTIYEMLCRQCGHRYGANGTDVWLRRCPSHDQGTSGEPLRERSQATLFLGLE